MHTEFWMVNLLGNAHSEDLGNQRIPFRWILRKCDVRVVGG
jgi:hypothetical protein